MAAMVVSCNIEKPVQPETPKSDEIQLTINASLEGTKTYITHDSDGYYANWSSSDKIAVVYSSDYSKRTDFTYNGSVFAGSLTVKNLGDNRTLNAYYPNSISISNKKNGSYDFTLPDQQVLPSLTSFDQNADLLIARPVTVDFTEEQLSGDKINTSVDMVFRRAICILKVILEDNTTDRLLDGALVSNIRIQSGNDDIQGDYIAGRCLNAFFAGNSPDQMISNSACLTSVNASYSGNDFTVDGENAAFIIVAPNKFSKDVPLTIDVETNNPGLTIHKVVTPSNDIALNAGKVKPLRIKLTDNDVEVEGAPVISELVIDNVPAEGVTDATASLTFFNANGWASSVVSFDGCVSSASIEGSVLTYSISENTLSSTRTGSIVIKLSKEGQDDITSTILVSQQRGGSEDYSWDFSSEEWQEALSKQAPGALNNNAENWSVSLNGLSYISGTGNGKWSESGYIQPNGGGYYESSSKFRRIFQFSSQGPGYIYIWVTGNANSGKSATVYAQNGYKVASNADFSKTTASITASETEMIEFGKTSNGAEWTIYLGASGLRVTKIEFHTNQLSSE